MKYLIEWFEQSTTSTGKVKGNATIKDEKGTVIENVTMWADGWTNFAELKAGMEVNGDYQEKQNGQYTNKTLYQAKTYNTMSGAKPAGNMVKVMEKKQENITKSMDRKDNSIMLSGTARDATILTAEWVRMESSTGLPVSTDEIKKKWLEFRAWLLTQHGDSSDVTTYTRHFNHKHPV